MTAAERQRPVTHDAMLGDLRVAPLESPLERWPSCPSGLRRVRHPGATYLDCGYVRWALAASIRSGSTVQQDHLAGLALPGAQNVQIRTAPASSDHSARTARSAALAHCPMRRLRPYCGPERRAVRSACRLVAPTTAAAVSAVSTALLPWLFAVLSAARSAHGRAEQARKDRLCARFCQCH